MDQGEQNIAKWHNAAQLLQNRQRICRLRLLAEIILMISISVDALKGKEYKNMESHYVLPLRGPGFLTYQKTSTCRQCFSYFLRVLSFIFIIIEMVPVTFRKNFRHRADCGNSLSSETNSGPVLAIAPPSQASV